MTAIAVGLGLFWLALFFDLCRLTLYARDLEDRIDQLEEELEAARGN